MVTHVQAVPNFKEEQSAKIPALTLLTNLGYTFIPPSECLVKRGNSSNVILPDVLRDVLKHKTYSFMGKEHHLSGSTIDKIIQELAHPAMNEGLRVANEKLYNALTYGISVTEFVDGKKASPTIQIIDWKTASNNQYHFTEELEVENVHGTGRRIPDIVCFVNGLPWVVIEAKRPDSSSAGKPTVAEGISQNIRNQKVDEIPHLFAYSQLLLSVNGHEGLYGTCGTPEKFWAKWKEEEEIAESTFARLKNTPLAQDKLDLIFNHRPVKVRDEYQSLIAGGDLVVTDQDRLLVSLLRHERLLDMARLYTLFDKKAGKIVARYQQVFGIKALIERVTSFDKKGARNGGVIWHTTGSGKSFTMVFLSKALIWLKELAKCRVVVVTDRVDLEDQLARTFKSAGALSDKDQKSAMATTGQRLAEQIGKGNERIIFSIINKFATAIELPECYNDSPDIIVLVDEGHRSQNGENNIRMQQALPKAAYIGFTGTPLLQDDKTENKFGKIIHSYTMQQAVEDKTVTPLLYEERIADLCTNDRAIDAWFDRITDKLSEKQRTDLKKKFAQKGQIYQTEGRIELIAHDISDHFQNFKQQGLKGQLACDSKTSAIQYKKLLDKIGKVTSVVAMSPPDTREGHDSVDGESTDLVQNWWKANVTDKGWHDEKAYTKHIIADFAEDDGADLMIVVDKLLTGFDEPKNTVLYIDKPLKQHNLIQAIARVNRLHAKKLFGYLIDYRGILNELDTTIADYQELAERTLGGFDIDDLKGLYNRMDTEYKKLPGLYSELWAIFEGVNNKQDGQALRQVLAPKIDMINGQLTDTNQKKREDFYASLTAFLNCLKVALQSATYFEDKSFDAIDPKTSLGTRDLYKKTLKFMSELRKQVREDAEETIDYDEYAENIRTMLNKHIGGVEIQEPKGAYLVGNMGKTAKPEDMSDDEARNKKDAITGRVTKMIEQDLADDPYAQEYFSKLLKKAIEQAKEMFDAPVKQYLLFADFEEQVKERKVDGMPTDRFSELDPQIKRHVQAYFGLFLKHLPEPKPLSEDDCFNYSLQIDEIVTAAVAEFSINPQEIENQIRRQLLPILFKAVGMTTATGIIADIIQITRLGIAGHH